MDTVCKDIVPGCELGSLLQVSREVKQSREDAVGKTKVSDSVTALESKMRTISKHQTVFAFPFLPIAAFRLQNGFRMEQQWHLATTARWPCIYINSERPEAARGRRSLPLPLQQKWLTGMNGAKAFWLGRKSVTQHWLEVMENVSANIKASSLCRADKALFVPSGERPLVPGCWGQAVGTVVVAGWKFCSAGKTVQKNYPREFRIN